VNSVNTQQQPLKFVLICVETRADKAALAAAQKALCATISAMHKREALPAKKETKFIYNVYLLRVHFQSGKLHAVRVCASFDE
jgi:hypothetical protein